jgi:SAM-dependent methyltransferase
VRAAVTERWTRYYAAAGGDPRPTLLAALERFEDDETEHERLAVDLGCGTGRDTLELLRRGWRVLAIDAEIEAIERLGQLDEAVVAWDRLQTLVADFESAHWPSVALVNASYSLPFCPPGSFARLWERIATSLLPGGRFCGQLFGDRDEWASPGKPTAGWSSPPGMTFHTRADVDMLLRDFEIEQLIEIDEDGTTAVGDPKHWHLFHVVAQKRDH